METRCTKDRAPIHGGGPALEGQSPELHYLLRAVNKLDTFIQAALTNLLHESIEGWLAWTERNNSDHLFIQNQIISFVNDPLKVEVPVPNNFCHEDLSDTKHLE